VILDASSHDNDREFGVFKFAILFALVNIAYITRIRYYFADLVELVKIRRGLHTNNELWAQTIDSSRGVPIAGS
jgi:hypothetical protein